MNRNELYAEIQIAKEGEWAERFTQLTALYFERYGVAYWDHQEDPEGAKQKQITSSAYSKDVEKIKIGDWVCVNAKYNGTKWLYTVEQVQEISETKAFILLNGRRMKKGTHRIISL